MDARITKKRLSENLQYDWIKIIVCVVAVIILWELIFTVSGVRLSAGQEFKVYYYSTMNASSSTKMRAMLDKKGVLSYDVLEKNIETLTKDYEATVLSARVSVSEGDIMFIDNVLTESSEEYKKQDVRCSSSNFRNFINGYSVYDYDSLLEDAKRYLENFKTNGQFDSAKIEQSFRKRMKKDNRFRKEEKIQDGIIQETKRLEKLQSEVNAFSYIIEKYGDTDLFVNEVYGEYYFFSNLDEANYKSYIENGTVNGSEMQGQLDYYKAQLDEGAKKFAINANYLKDGANSIFNLVSVYDKTDSSDACICVFNFKSAQPDLQFETISVINEIIRNYSNLFNDYSV